MVKENPIHKQQIEPVLMADRFPTYDLDGRLAADGAEVHMILSGLETQLATAYWDAFNALPIVTRKIEGDLLESYIRGSARHMQTKYADAGGQEAATIACQNTHMALRVGLPIATVLSCIGESHKLAIHYVIEACAGDTARQTRLTAAINRLALLEMDIMLAYAEKLDRAAISQERQALASDFDRSIASLVQDSDGVRQQLAKQATSADHAARGMIAETPSCRTIPWARPSTGPIISKTCSAWSSSRRWSGRTACCSPSPAGLGRAGRSPHSSPSPR